jgi:hypothetical protein
MKYFITLTLFICVAMQPAYSQMQTATFNQQRDALIIKHSHHDVTFAMMQKNTLFTSEYWRWRLDQYMYAQYPEYQVIYDAYTAGKSFGQIYNLPKEDLGPKFEVPTHLPKIPAGFFTGNMHGNSHTGSHQVNGDTIYITYQGDLTDPYVASYNMTTDSWTGPFKAGHSELSKGERKLDSHGRPIIEVDTLGYIHIIFGGHGGDREDGLNPLSIDTAHAGGRMKHVVSTKPYDISEFTIVNDITPFASYTKSYQMGNGDIYFFTRTGTHKSPWVYYKMLSGSKTFEPPVIITLPTVDINNPILVDTFYINPLKISDTEIAITSLWHACNFKEEHDKTHYNRLNAYYMKLDTTNDTFYNVSNDKLSLPLTLAAANKYTLAYNSEKHKETSFSTRPLIHDNGLSALAYEARGKDYREWRMASYHDGSWTHGLPIPGTQNRLLIDMNGEQIQAINKLDVLTIDNENATAAVIYKNAFGKTIFATATRPYEANSMSNTWQVQQTFIEVVNGKLQQEIVTNAAGENIAVIVNVKKGNSQRLYLWHKGELKPTN